MTSASMAVSTTSGASAAWANDSSMCERPV